MYAINSFNMAQIVDAISFIANNVTDPKAASVLAFNFSNNTVNITCGSLFES